MHPTSHWKPYMLVDLGAQCMSALARNAPPDRPTDTIDANVDASGRSPNCDTTPKPNSHTHRSVSVKTE